MRDRPFDVLLATYDRRPDPAPDDQLLVDRLRAWGWRVGARSWTDPRRPWSYARAVVVRSTWDYYRDRARFLRWASAVARRSSLWNPLPVLRWNTDKSYLARLGRRGIPVVPTRTVLPGRSFDWDSVVASLGGERVVIKPRVSADGFLSDRFGATERRRGTAHLRRVLATGAALVQRYLPAVEDREERSLVYLDGRYSHAVRRTPILLPGGRGGPEPAAPAPRAARRLADRVLEVVGGSRLLYARVDVVPDPEGRFRLLELELTEPTLYLDRDARAPGRLARAIERRLAESPSGRGGPSTARSTAR